MQNTFFGEDSIKNYLNPENHTTPLVQLPSFLNKYEKEWIHIYAKLLQNLPLYNIKSIPVYNMITQQDERNKTIIESSSWNTSYCLCVIWRILWYKSTVSYASEDVGEWKLDLLRFFGSKVVINQEPICPDPSDETSSINIAKKLGKQQDYINFWQYENSKNPEAHYNHTWPQIYNQLEGNIDYFCTSLWTTGSFIGSTTYLKEQDKNIKSIWVVRKPNNPVPGPRTYNLLSQISFDREEKLDFLQEVSTKRSYLQSLHLSRHWIIAWPSSGMNLEWVFNFIKENYNELQNQKDKKGDLNIVFVCCDLPFMYLKEYFKYLDEELFPPIKNKHLLKNKDLEDINNDIEISAETFFDDYFGKNPEKVWELINKWEKIYNSEDMLLIDIRESKYFQHFSIPNSINVQAENIENYLEDKKEKSIYLLCEYWGFSNHIADKLRNKWYNAFSIKWWTIEWSKFDLPRIRHETCSII